MSPKDCSRKGPYEIITDRIIAALESGTVPWRKPWNSESIAPRSILGHRYRGVNVFMTALAGYECPFWITYKQARKMGGYVRKGEKGTPIVFWKWLDKVETDTATGERRERKIPLLRYYTVFNASQCDGIETPKMPSRPADFSPIDSAERIVAGMPKQPEIRHGMSGAFYRPADDLVGCSTVPGGCPVRQGWLQEAQQSQQLRCFDPCSFRWAATGRSSSRHFGERYGQDQ